MSMKQLFTPLNIIILAAIILVGWELCKQRTETFLNEEVPMPEASDEPVPTEEVNGKTSPYSGDSDFMQISDPSSAKIEMPKCAGTASSFLSTSLLPKDDPQLDDSFAEFSPANLKGENFIDSTKYVIGMQSQTLRNPNLQLRSDPPIPKESVCPWNNSTINPESRRAVELGE